MSVAVLHAIKPATRISRLRIQGARCNACAAAPNAKHFKKIFVAGGDATVEHVSHWLDAVDRIANLA